MGQAAGTKCTSWEQLTWLVGSSSTPISKKGNASPEPYERSKALPDTGSTAISTSLTFASLYLSSCLLRKMTIDTVSVRFWLYQDIWTTLWQMSLWLRACKKICRLKAAFFRAQLLNRPNDLNICLVNVYTDNKIHEGKIEWQIHLY